MDEETFDSEFFETANALIKNANEQAATLGEHKVGIAFLYAAARYHAYIAASSVTCAEDLEAGKDKAVKYFSDRFSQLFEANLADYIANFDEYTQPSETEA